MCALYTLYSILTQYSILYTCKPPPSHLTQSHPTYSTTVLHPSQMGQIAQDGENGQNLSLFFWSFTVTKQFDFFKFSELF